MTLITNFATHPHLGAILTLSSDDGWARVGIPDTLLCREHWFPLCGKIAVRCTADKQPQPFLCVSHARYAMTRGRYAERLQAQPEYLRLPAEILKNQDTRLPNQSLSWLNGYEAQVLCELNCGRLATEKEADVIIQACALERTVEDLSVRPYPTAVYNPPNSLSVRPEQVWTTSPWSEWNYALCAWRHGQWRAHPVPLHEEKEYLSVFSLTRANRAKHRPEEVLTSTGAILVYDV